MNTPRLLLLVVALLVTSLEFIAIGHASHGYRAERRPAAARQAATLQAPAHCAGVARTIAPILTLC